MRIPQDYRLPPPSADSPLVPLGWGPRKVLSIGLTCWLVSYGLAQLTESDTGIPALFLPAGIAIGLLLRLPLHMWWWVLAVMASVDMLGGPVLGVAPWRVCLIWGVANVTQTVMVAGVLRRGRVDMTRPRDPLVLATVSALIVALVAVAGSLALGQVIDIDPAQFWADWWGSDVLSIVLIVPVVLLLGRARPPRGRQALQAWTWFILAAVMVSLYFSETVNSDIPAWVFLVLGTPLVVLYGVRFGLLAMSALLLSLTLIAVAYTAADLGPFQELATERGSPLRSLQMVLLVLAVSVQCVSLLISRLLRHGRTLAGQQALLDAVLEGSPVPTAVVGPDGSVLLRTNLAFRDLLPVASDDVLDCFPASEREGIIALLDGVTPNDGQVATGEFAAVGRDREPLSLRLRVTGVLADDFDRDGSLRAGMTVARVLNVEDMTEVRSREERLRRDAITDPLTGLANRRHMLQAIEVALADVGPGRLVALTYLDLDGFKAVNDNRGHSMGDAVLHEVAVRLRACVRPGDLIARAGGDEFVVVSTDVPDPDVATRRARQLLDGLSSQPVLGCDIGASVGVVVTSNAFVGPSELLKRADELMYQAKTLGGTTVCSAGP